VEHAAGSSPGRRNSSLRSGHSTLRNGFVQLFDSMIWRSLDPACVSIPPVWQVVLGRWGKPGRIGRFILPFVLSRLALYLGCRAGRSSKGVKFLHTRQQTAHHRRDRSLLGNGPILNGTRTTSPRVLRPFDEATVDRFPCACEAPLFASLQPVPPRRSESLLGPTAGTLRPTCRT